MARNVIILNHMFTGEYLVKNVGHEIINLFTSDYPNSDGSNHYIYLCKDGKFNRDDVFVEYVVQVRRPDKLINTLEVINIALDLKKYDKEQEEPLYGGVPISKIFAYNLMQQENCVTFVARQMRKPKIPLYIWNKKNSKSSNNVGVVLQDYNPSQNLREYIYEEFDENGETKKDSNYYRLKQLITGDLTELTTLPKVDMECNTSESIAEIYGIIGRELSYSDAFRYFIEKHPKLFLDLFGVKNEEIDSIFREYYNMDLFVKCKRHWVVIENKIFSGLNGTNGTQLSSYVEKVKALIEYTDEINVIFILLCPDHNNIILSNSDKKYWKKINYSEIYKGILDYKEEYDSDEWAELDGFAKSLEPHTQIDYNFSLMQKKFVRNICKSKSYK